MSDVFDDTPEGDTGWWTAPKVKPADPRSSAAYKSLHEQFLNHARLHRNADGSHGLPCSLCSRDIDYRYRWPHPLSPVLHHDQSVRDHPELALVWSNFKAVHKLCNERQGAEPDADELDLGEPSEIW